MREYIASEVIKLLLLGGKKRLIFLLTAAWTLGIHFLKTCCGVTVVIADCWEMIDQIKWPKKRDTETPRQAVPAETPSTNPNLTKPNLTLTVLLGAVVLGVAGVLFLYWAGGWVLSVCYVSVFVNSAFATYPSHDLLAFISAYISKTLSASKTLSPDLNTGCLWSIYTADAYMVFFLTHDIAQRADNLAPVVKNVRSVRKHKCLSGCSHA